MWIISQKSWFWKTDALKAFFVPDMVPDVEDAVDGGLSSQVVRSPGEARGTGRKPSMYLKVV